MGRLSGLSGWFWRSGSMSSLARRQHTAWCAGGMNSRLLPLFACRTLAHLLATLRSPQFMQQVLLVNQSFLE
jgi:hypothetical protein